MESSDRRMKFILCISVGLVAIAAAACSQNAAVTEPTATRAPLALVTDTQRALPIVDETETPTGEPTATTEGETETPTVPDTDTPTPSATATLTPTLILPPIVFLPPADGGMSITADWSDNGLRIELFADDAAAGNNNGDGIDHVEIFIQDLQGNVIAEKRLDQAPYCYFGPEQDDCHSVQQGTAEFEWSAGKPIERGYYLVRAVAYTTSKKILVDEQPLNITIPVDTLENLFVNIDEPGSDRVRDTLDYEASVSGVGVDTTTGEGVDRVEMFVVDYNGNLLNSQIARTPVYCGFGAAGLNQPCNVYDFAAHDLKWQNGDAIGPTEYILRAVVYAKDGRIAAQSEVIRIQLPSSETPSPSPPPTLPTDEESATASPTPIE